MLLHQMKIPKQRVCSPSSRRIATTTDTGTVGCRQERERLASQFKKKDLLCLTSPLVSLAGVTKMPRFFWWCDTRNTTCQKKFLILLRLIPSHNTQRTTNDEAATKKQETTMAELPLAFVASNPIAEGDVGIMLPSSPLQPMTAMLSPDLLLTGLVSQEIQRGGSPP